VVIAVLSAVFVFGTWLALPVARGDPQARAVPATSATDTEAPSTTARVASAGPTAGILDVAAVDDIGNLVPVGPPGIPTTQGSAAPSTSAHGPTAMLTLDVQVVDANGHPFASGAAGILLCRNGRPQTACDGGVASQAPDSDGDGHVQLSLQSGAVYQMNAFVAGTGWPNPWLDDNGNGFHFSETVAVDVVADGPQATYSVRDDTKHSFPVFEIIRPVAVSVRVLHDDGSPFPPGTAGVNACVVDSNGTCPAGNEEWRTARDDDGDGIVVIGLDPGVKYRVQGIAINTGWCDPWRSPDGVEMHIGTTLSPVTGDQLQGRTFVVDNPCVGTASTDASTTTPTSAPSTSEVTTTTSEVTTTPTVTTSTVTTSSEVTTTIAATSLLETITS
jgi:hypothetical protein